MEFHETEGFPETAIRLVSGHVFDYANPMGGDFDYHDVAHALARVSRFAGHTATPIGYSVANHAIFVAELVTFIYHQPELALAALHHDDVEFVTGDWPSPMKRYIKSRGFDYKRELERPIESAITHKLGLVPDDLHAGVIKDADRLAFVTEGIAFKPMFDPSDQGFDDIEQEILLAASNYLFIGATTHIEGIAQDIHAQLMNGADAAKVFKSLGLTVAADALEQDDEDGGSEPQDA
jgi:5'-deoxynucleotidase YfbR-like HD superfamily hydrolase